MVTIETEHGRFEGETIKAAQSLARKAEREARRAMLDREERRKLAYIRAESNGFKVLTAVMEEKKVLHHWWYQSAGCRFLRIQHGAYGDTIAYEFEHGTESYDHNGYRIIGTLSNSAGFTLIIFTREISTGQEYALAVGAEGDALAFVTLPDCVRPDCFRAAVQD